MNARTLRQTDVESPEAFAQAMPTALFERMRLKPVPVLFLRQQKDERDWQWAGFCNGNSYTEFGEVVLDTRLVERGEWEPILEGVRAVYLHEVAHRLMPGHKHNAAFHAMALVLYLRAGETNGRPLWHFSKLYDWQDEGDLPRAFAWAWHIAGKLAGTEESAERCAQIIAERYAAWRAWLVGEDDRRATAQALTQAAQTGRKEEVRRLREARWWCALTGFIAGVAFAAWALTR